MVRRNEQKERKQVRKRKEEEERRKRGSKTRCFRASYLRGREKQKKHA